MPKDKNYKRLAKNAAEDKVNNTIFIMKFLNSKGGLDLIREYFVEAIPSYVLDFAGPGGAKKWVMRQWARKGALGYMKKIMETFKEDAEFINPSENYEIVEESEEQIVTQLKCKYRKRLIKTGKKCQCDFDVQDYYCNHACIPLLTKLYADAYMKISVALTKEGCIQTVQVDHDSLSKDGAADEQGAEDK